MSTDKSGREFALRVIAAALLAPPVLAAVWFGAPWFALVVLLAVLVAGYEWRGLCALASPGPGLLSLLGAALVVVAAIVYGLPTGLILLGVLAGAGGVAALTLRREWGWALLGLVYVGLPALALLALRGVDLYGETVFLLLLVVWSTDIGAYAVGRTLGGPRLAPALSPGKTWAGALGGLAAAIIAAVVAGSLLSGDNTVKLAVVAALVSLAGQAGDLFESWLKRRFGHKDTGVIIPGHGGVLDRIDSLLFAAPAMLAIIVVESGELPLWH